MQQSLRSWRYGMENRLHLFHGRGILWGYKKDTFFYWIHFIRSLFLFFLNFSWIFFLNRMFIGHCWLMHNDWKLLKMSHWNFPILALSNNFGDLSGNTFGRFEKVAKMDTLLGVPHFWHFKLILVHSKLLNATFSVIFKHYVMVDSRKKKK